MRAYPTVSALAEEEEEKREKRRRGKESKFRVG